MQTSTIVFSLLGGVLIGLSATLLLGLHGRVAGISGIIGEVLKPNARPSEREWRVMFLLGMLVAGSVLHQVMPDRFELGVERSIALVAIAGVLVGIGTRVGSGCTSGHGVCGVSRGSVRSIVATLVFLTTGMLTVFAHRTLEGLK